jgi:Ca2+-binding RTX toxin-like protein
VANISDDAPATGNPYLDSLIWGGSWVRDGDDPPGVPQIAYYLASGPDFFGWSTQPWTQRETDAIRTAFQLYENVANVDFVEVFNESDADITERLTSYSHPFLDGAIGAHEVPDPTDWFEPLWGYYAVDDESWNNLTPGSYGFVTVIHELGHALGLAHPHDGGYEDEQVFPGVTPNNTKDKGDYGLNQGIWTTMSYNDGWNQDPRFDPLDYGWQATPMAFDVAAVQAIYGANMTFKTGSDTYDLPTIDGLGTFWSCIWDAGGIDEINAEDATGACKINLNDATLQPGDPNAGGFVSWMQGISGGFTIANGVVIENATGGGGNDTLTGNEVANILTGNAGNDSLDGGAGADDMLGGAGGDTYVVDDAGDDVVDDGVDGTDLVKSSLDYVLDANIENLQLSGAEDIDGTGNGLANLLIGNDADNLLDGDANNDSMQGGLGDDTYVIDALGDSVTEASKAGTDTVRSKNNYSLGANLENLVLLAAVTALMATGNALANQLTGNDEDNTLDGLAGIDVMTGGKGNDLYIMDVAGDQVFETGDDAGDEVRSAVAFKNAIDGIEHYTFTGKTAVAFTADDEDTDNRIVATAAADTLDGGKGNDTLTGGAGNDVYFVDAATDDVTEDLNKGTDVVKSSSDFELGENIEKLELTGDDDIDGKGNALANTITGNSGANLLEGETGNDTLSGGEGADTLDGGAGNDAMTGGGGDDVYVVGIVTDKVTESSAAGGKDTVKSTVDYTLGNNVENLELTAGDTKGTGNALGNLIVGSGGNNTLDGKAGADILRGGLGDDLYIVDALNEADETGGGGNDTIQIGATVDLGALAGIENATLTGTGGYSGTGTAGGNAITGNSGANLLSGADGNDTLDGGAGNDTMIGGGDDDTYVVNSTKDEVDESGSGGTDTIRAPLAIDLTLPPYDGVENVVLTGTAGLKVTGDEQDNQLAGNDGANLLTGGAGTDTIAGGNGNDTLDGGADGDVDSLAGGLGNDTYLIGEVGEIVTEAEGEGTDVVRSAVSHTLAANVENLVLLAGAADAIGNGLKNSLTGNETANKLDGGLLADTLVGGKGDDTYFVDDAKDIVTEAAGKDVDTVHSTAGTYTLAVNIENLILDGTDDIGGTGNTLNNILTGNSGDNTLNGAAGADTMNGGLGNDTYVYDGKDAIDDLGGVDVVQASLAIDLTLAAFEDIEGVRLTGSGALAATGDGGANLLAGNGGANKLSGGDGNDTLQGGGGADILDGGTGNDLFLYTSKLDGKDVINNFAAGQDVLDLDALFDSLSVATELRDERVALADKGGSVEVRVDADGKASNGPELFVAVLNTADDVVLGTDVVVGAL